MKTIKDLSADELADYAFHVFLHSGRHAMGAGLIYRCLELDQYHPLGLRCLSDFLDWNGSESVSALVLEYLIDNNLAKTQESQAELERLLFTCKWVWGFSKHKSGDTQLSGTEFENEDDFAIDLKGYAQFKQSTFNMAGTWEGVLKGAHNLIGVYGGVAHSPSLTETHTPVDMLGITDFTAKPEYTEFLGLDTSQLEQVKQGG